MLTPVGCFTIRMHLFHNIHLKKLIWENDFFVSSYRTHNHLHGQGETLRLFTPVSIFTPEL